MTESDKRIDTLADRAKEAADRVHASTSKTKEKVEAQVLEARAAADKTTQELQAKAADSRDEATQRWSEIRQDWRDHIAKIQKKIDADKQESRADRAEFRAEVAEEDWPRPRRSCAATTSRRSTEPRRGGSPAVAPRSRARPASTPKPRGELASSTWEGIVDVADELDAAVIVIGSRGLTGVKKIFDASASQQVAEHAGHPVPIFPPPR